MVRGTTMLHKCCHPFEPLECRPTRIEVLQVKVVAFARTCVVVVIEVLVFEGIGEADLSNLNPRVVRRSEIVRISGSSGCSLGRLGSDQRL